MQRAPAVELLPDHLRPKFCFNKIQCMERCGSPQMA